MTYRIIETFGKQTILAAIHHHEQLTSMNLFPLNPWGFHMAAAQESSQFIYL
jgi:hypothetical protein